MKYTFLVLFVVLATSSCEKENSEKPEAVIISASGDINPKLNEFRTMLGNVLNNTTGQTSGRREINWDAVPDIYATEKLPSNFFNPVTPGSPEGLQRGFRYSTDVEARVSGNGFADFDASNGTEFSSFSGTKTFSAISSNLWNVDFEVAGQPIEASVRGFGAVFSDVDNSSSTTMEFFAGEKSLGVYPVPAKTTGNHSFLGVYFPKEKVTRVKIKQGDAVVANGVKDVSSGGTKDLVIMDDFLYDEPKAVQ
jgi:hypothetical protein